LRPARDIRKFLGGILDAVDEFHFLDDPERLLSIVTAANTTLWKTRLHIWLDRRVPGTIASA
jgi:hypothetical protein